MIIYFAGNVTPPREETLIKYQTDRLFSFFYHGEQGEFFDEFKLRMIKLRKEDRNEK